MDEQIMQAKKALDLSNELYEFMRTKQATIFETMAAAALLAARAAYASGNETKAREFIDGSITAALRDLHGAKVTLQ